MRRDVQRRCYLCKGLPRMCSYNRIWKEGETPSSPHSSSLSFPAVGDRRHGPTIDRRWESSCSKTSSPNGHSYLLCPIRKLKELLDCWPRRLFPVLESLSHFSLTEVRTSSPTLSWICVSCWESQNSIQQHTTPSATARWRGLIVH